MGTHNLEGFGRYLPLKPSDIFWAGSGKPSFGRTLAVSHPENTRSLTGNSKPGGFSDLTHNDMAPKEGLVYGALGNCC